jgi:tetratricopeptide (TPR) repeat protein
LRVWIDEHELSAFSPVTKEARTALGESKAMLVYYSSDYGESAACQWELRRAFTAALGYGDPTRRVLVVNPEAGVDHIEPVTLRDAQHLTGASAQPDAVAKAVVRHLATLNGSLGDAPIRVSRWLPAEPPSAPRFVGRIEEMWQIHSALWRSESQMTEARAEGSSCVVVSGFAGLGKSLLAQEYALRFAGAYPGGVVWLSAEFDADRASQLRELVRKLMGLGRDVGLEDLTAKDLAAVVWRLLAKDGAYLWIVDNLPSETPREVAVTWLAPAPGRTIVTTRGREHAGWAPVVPLDVLSRDDARVLLTERKAPESDAEAEAANAVLATLMGHPFALDVAGARTRTQSYSELFAGISGPVEHDPVLGTGLREELPTNYRRGVAVALQVSVGLLGNEARDILWIASVVSAEPLPEDLLNRIMSACDGIDESSAIGRRATGIAELDIYSLVAPAGPRRWVVHRLVSRTVSGIEDARGRRHELRSAAVGVLAERIGAGADSWAAGELIAHGRALVDMAATPAELDLMHAIAQYEGDRGALGDAEAHFRREHAVRERLLGPDDTTTLRALSGVASALCRRGETVEATRLQRKVLARRQQLWGTEHEETLAAMAELAESHRQNGEPSSATELDQTVLATRERFCAPDDLRTLDAKAALALDLGFTGSMQRARALFEEVYEARRRILGPGHPDTIKSGDNLAMLLSVGDEFDEALALAETIANAAEQTFGAEHPLTLHALSILAGLHMQFDDAEARDLYDRILAGRQKIFGQDHPATIDIEINQATLYQQEGDLQTARTIQEHAIARLRERLGPEHPNVLSARSKLATTLAADGDLDGARETLRDVLKIRTQRFGLNNGPTLTVMTLLAGTYIISGDFRAAKRQIKEAIRISTATFGRGHSRTTSLEEMLEFVNEQRRTRRALFPRGNR